MCIVRCAGSHLQISTLHNTSLHITHQQVAEDLNHSGSQTSILAVRTHAHTHIVNSNISVNFNQEYVQNHTRQNVSTILLIAANASCSNYACKIDVFSNPWTGTDRPLRPREVEAPRFPDNRHMKAIRLSALRTSRLYPPGNTPGTHFC